LKRKDVDIFYLWIKNNTPVIDNVNMKKQNEKLEMPYSMELVNDVIIKY